MRIAYVCYWDAYAVDGVAAKLQSQAAAWRRHGHTARVFCLSPRGTAGATPVLDGSIFQFAGWRARAGATLALQRAVEEFSPDVVYLRYDLFIPPLGRLLSRHPSAVEINTDQRELALRAPRARVYDGFNRRSLLRGATGIVCLTHELRSRAVPPGKPAVVIANGIDLDGVRVVPAPQEGPPTLAFLAGSPDPWQGVDKVIEMARALPEWRFAVVGDHPDGRAPDMPSNVALHGRARRDEYSRILADADVGIGTLALHRKSMSEACPLKVREYLAHGLPVVVAYEDTEFRGADLWYLLRLPNRESNVRDGLDAIRTFVAAVRGRRVPHDEVAPRIATEVKEAARLRFFEQLRAA